MVGLVQRDGLVAVDQNFASLWVRQRGRSQSAADPVLQGDVAVRRRPLWSPTVQRSAVLTLDNYFLGHVDQPACQIPAARGVKRSVGQTLAGAVGGQEVFQGRQAFAEVGLNRQFDDVGASGPAHQASHTGHLVDLRNVALGSREGHDAYAAVVGQVTAYQVGGFERGLVPGVNDFGVAFLLRNQAHFVLGLVLVHPLFGIGHNLGLFRGHLDVIDGYGNSRCRGVPEAQVLDSVQDLGGLVVVQKPVQVCGQGVQCAAIDQFVLDAHGFRQAFVEYELVGQDGIKFQAAHCCGVVTSPVLPAPDPPDINGRPKVDFACLEGIPGLGNILELASGAFYVRPLFLRVDVSQVVAAHHHVQGRCHERVTRRWRKHVVGAEHRLLGLQHCHTGQRHVHRHLVAVEVGVESRAH